MTLFGLTLVSIWSQMQTFVSPSGTFGTNLPSLIFEPREPSQCPGQPLGGSRRKRVATRHRFLRERVHCLMGLQLNAREICKMTKNEPKWWQGDLGFYETRLRKNHGQFLVVLKFLAQLSRKKNCLRGPSRHLCKSSQPDFFLSRGNVTRVIR